MKKQTSRKNRIGRTLRIAAALLLVAALMAAAGCSQPEAKQIDTGSDEGFSSLAGQDDLQQFPTPTSPSAMSDIIPTPTPEVQTNSALAQQIVGMWQVLQVTAEGITEDVSDDGSGILFKDSGQIVVYDYYEQTGEATWQVTAAGTIEVKADASSLMVLSNIQMEAGGSAFSCDVSSMGIQGQMYLVKTTESAFLAGAQPSPTQTAANPAYAHDQELSALITREWNVMLYLEADGTESYDVFEQNIIFYTDGTFDEVYDGEEAYGEWSLDNGILQVGYLGWQEGEGWAYPISIEFAPELNAYKMYMEVWDYATGEGIGEYFVFTDYQP